MRHILPFLLFAAAVCSADAPAGLTADQIMQRVAANQDRAETLRRQYVYSQHVHVVSRKTNGKVMREETADYNVVPDEHGSSKKLTRLEGKYWHKSEYVSYSGEPIPDTDSLDADLVTDMRDDLTDEHRSKNGVAANLFPLTSKEQQDYQFKLLGEQTLNGRSVYRISFWPKGKGDDPWKGEAFIDKEDFQPVNVFTKLSRKVPFFVRTALGTDVPGVGFSVTYGRQPDGVWFPVSFGTEFRLRAVFFINREIAISLKNTNFEKTHVDSVVHYDAMNQKSDLTPR